MLSVNHKSVVIEPSPAALFNISDSALVQCWLENPGSLDVAVIPKPHDIVVVCFAVSNKASLDTRGLCTLHDLLAYAHAATALPSVRPSRFFMAMGDKKTPAGALTALEAELLCFPHLANSRLRRSGVAYALVGVFARTRAVAALCPQRLACAMFSPAL